MANPERPDTVYSNETNKSVYTRESNATGWFVGIIVALALLAIAYLVFSANTGPATTSVDVTTPPATTTEPAPMTEAPATPTEPAPMTEAPATEAPATPPPASEAPATPAEPAPPAEGTTAPATP